MARFEDETSGSGADDRGYGMGVTAGDYNNDGDVDERTNRKALQLSGNFRALPGGSLGGTYAVNSAIAGVPLTGGGTLNVQLVDPSTLFADYLNQFDLRLMRIFRVGRMRAQALLDIYNVFNASTATTLNQTSGPLWLRPQQIVQGRYLRFGT